MGEITLKVGITSLDPSDIQTKPRRTLGMVVAISNVKTVVISLIDEEIPHGIRKDNATLADVSGDRHMRSGVQRTHNLFAESRRTVQ